MININEKSLSELNLFLIKYPSPKVVASSAIYSGYVSCVRPIKTICGPELMCNPDTMFHVYDVINKARGE